MNTICCTRCNKPLPMTARFCRRCGNPTVRPAYVRPTPPAIVAPPPPAIIAPPPRPAQTAPPQPLAKTKSGGGFSGFVVVLIIIGAIWYAKSQQRKPYRPTYSPPRTELKVPPPPPRIQIPTPPKVQYPTPSKTERPAPVRIETREPAGRPTIEFSVPAPRSQGQSGNTSPTVTIRVENPPRFEPTRSSPYEPRPDWRTYPEKPLDRK